VSPPRPARAPDESAGATLVSSPADVRLGEMASGLAGAVATAGRAYLDMALSLVSRPRATLSSGVVEPQVDALGTTELIAWSLPPWLALSVAGALGSAVSARGTPTTALSVASALMVGVLGGLVGSVLTAVLWHPLLSFVVRLLGGASDARLRSNLLVAHGAATVVLALAMLVGLAVSAIPLRATAAVPPVLTVLASALVLLVSRAWGQRLGLGRAFEALLAVAGLVVLAVGGRALLVAVTTPPPAVAAAERVSAELDDAASRLSRLEGRLPARPGPDTTAAAADGPRRTARSSVEEYRRRRDSIDWMVRNDSRVFERIDRLARLYTKLQHETDKVDKELARRGRKQKPPTDRQRDLALQARTAGLVDEVYALLTRARGQGER
jgi:hypothetical protein